LPPPHLFLAADPTGAVDLSVFAQYGVLGILTLMLIFFARGAYQRERDRADRLETEVQRLHELILDKVIPALQSASQAAEDSTALLQAMQRERELVQLIKRRDMEGGLP